MCVCVCVSIVEVLPANCCFKYCPHHLSLLPLRYYSGQYDMIVHHLGTEKMLAKLAWDHSEDYVKAPQIPWLLDRGAPSGYAKSAGVLTFLVVRNSGHMVPMDVPEAALDMITRFLKGEGFVSCLVLSCLVLSCLVWSGLALPGLVWSGLVWSCLILSCPV
jgi:hypothetical protein